MIARGGWIMLASAAVGVVAVVAGAGEISPPEADSATLEAMVRADWVVQERRLGRLPQSPAAIQAAAALLLEDVPESKASATWPSRRPSFSGWPTKLAELRRWTSPAPHGALPPHPDANAAPWRSRTRWLRPADFVPAMPAGRWDSRGLPVASSGAKAAIERVTLCKAYARSWWPSPVRLPSPPARLRSGYRGRPVPNCSSLGPNRCAASPRGDERPFRRSPGESPGGHQD